jgi:hypothetical protein
MIRRMKNARWLVLLAAAVAAGAAAQQYRWTDEKGKVHYTDTLPPASAKNVQKKVLTTNTFASPGRDAVPVAALAQYPVTLYTHAQCTDACDLARSVLKKRKVPFNEVVMSAHDGPADIRARTAGRPIPVLRAGFLVEMTASEATYNRLLDRAGYPPSAETEIRNQAQAPARDRPLAKGEKVGR